LPESRILTTHVGSLPRSPEVMAPLLAKARGEAFDAAVLDAALRDGVAEIVRKQIAAGVDFVSDGEFSKPSYATYVVDRLSGFGGTSKGFAAADLREFPDFARHLIAIGGVVPRGGGACCTGPWQCATWGRSNPISYISRRRLPPPSRTARS